MPEWWPKNHPFSSVRNSNRKLLLSIMEAYQSKDSGTKDNNTRDRSPIASPERSSHIDDDVVSSDLLSQATPEIIDFGLFNNDLHSLMRALLIFYHLLIPRVFFHIYQIHQLVVAEYKVFFSVHISTDIEQFLRK